MVGCNIGILSLVLLQIRTHYLSHFILQIFQHYFLFSFTKLIMLMCVHIWCVRVWVCGYMCSCVNVGVCLCV